VTIETPTAVRSSDDELHALREVVHDLVADGGGTARARHMIDSGATHDADAWRTLTEMGLAGLAVPEHLGGTGGGLADLCVVAEELGRALVPVPFLGSTVLAGQVLAACPEPDAALAGRVVAGEVLGLAAVDDRGRWDGAGPPIEVTDGRLSGRASHVVDGGLATLVIVAVRVDGGHDLFAVDPADAGVEMRPTRTLDLTRGLAVLELQDAPARRLTEGAAGAGVLDIALDRALVVLSAEMLGGAQACLDLTVEYAAARRQFGRTIGSFQAIKHRAADMLVQVEMSRSAVDRAVTLPTDDPRPLAVAAATAASWTAEAFPFVASETVHIHGGIGFTWEHDAHLYFRRARADAALLGNASFHRERLATLLAW
jgi:alkylation response protein AidB-like acyl-CoA dehydrogenase